jgi:hypothetical protein
MSNKVSTFGERVIGHEAAQASLAAQKGGADVFGKRVANAIPEPTAFQLAKKSSQFGAAVVGDAHQSDGKGKPGSISVEDLQKVLDANPTFFDSLYEGELARKEGPRASALEVFLLSEYGISGQGRSSVIDEINGMLGKTAVSAKQLANDHAARVKELDARQTRMDENALLGDAERVRSLRQRDENLSYLKEHGSKSAKEQLEAGAGDPSSDNQRRAIADKEGLDIGQDPSQRGDPILPFGVAGVVQDGHAPAKAGATTSGVNTTDAAASTEHKKGATADESVDKHSTGASTAKKPSKSKRKR